jgi:hypothetical protein
MRFFILTTLLLTVLLLKAQDKLIAEAFASSDYTSISQYFDQNIEIVTNTANGIYSKQQAKQIIKSFFEANPPNKYTQKHKGGSASRSFFEIGKLECGEKRYRTYLLYNLIQEKPQIIELRIEIED